MKLASAIFVVFFGSTVIGYLPCQRPCIANDGEMVRIDFIVHSKTELASGLDVYLAGSDASLGPWKPDGLKLDRADSPAQWRCHLHLKRGDVFEFKFTCGSWGSVEKGPQGEEIANRKLTADCSKSIDITVDAWGTKSVDRPSTASGDIRSLKIPDDAKKTDRSVNIWLPGGYAEETRRYPVLYLLDGQNVFDAKKAAFGVEWQADESAAKLLLQNRISPFLIVAIDNSPERLTEYTRSGDESEPDHLRWIVEVLKPQIDAEYRTMIEPESTTIGGSSLGGLFALDAFFSRGDVFGNAICMSPSLFWNDESLLTRIESGELRADAKPRRIWMDFGGKESSDPVRSAAHLARFQRLKLALEARHEIEGILVASQVDEDGEHNEAAWARRLPKAMTFLFEPPL
jgi:predicted alpha/beta superfamily hydrolase